MNQRRNPNTNSNLNPPKDAVTHPPAVSSRARRVCEAGLDPLFLQICSRTLSCEADAAHLARVLKLNWSFSMVISLNRVVIIGGVLVAVTHAPPPTPP